jgi:peroxin-19
LKILSRFPHGERSSVPSDESWRITFPCLYTVPQRFEKAKDAFIAASEQRGRREEVVKHQILIFEPNFWSALVSASERLIELRSRRTRYACGATIAIMSSRQAAAPVDASDDLDDLDDILDEFNTTNKAPAAASTSKKDDTAAKNDIPSTSIASTQTGNVDVENGEETEEEANERFARELAVGMEALMKDLGGPGGEQAVATGPETTADAGNENLFNEQEMMKQFEQMMADMGLGGMAGMEGLSGGDTKGATSSTSTSAAGGAPAAAPANFQDAIKSTMSRLRESDASASSSTGADADGMDLEKLMAALGGAEGIEGEEGISKMLESMMGELMSREILYEPLNELKEKVCLCTEQQGMRLKLTHFLLESTPTTLLIHLNHYQVKIEPDMKSSTASCLRSYPSLTNPSSKKEQSLKKQLSRQRYKH